MISLSLRFNMLGAPKINLQKSILLCGESTVYFVLLLIYGFEYLILHCR